MRRNLETAIVAGAFGWSTQTPAQLHALPPVLKRIDAVRKFRLDSKAVSAQKFAATPSLFCQIAQPAKDYLLVPRVPSERRAFIPIASMDKSVIVNDQVDPLLSFAFPESRH